MNIAVLLSGGVDSSVVVHLLCEQGHRPSLFYIKIGKDDAEYMDCSAEEDLEMASAVARRYGLSLEVVDLHWEYWDNVAAYAYTCFPFMNPGKWKRSAMPLSAARRII